MVGDRNAFVPLEWDSEHFGMSVCRLRSDLEDPALTEALGRARAAGFQLVYWPTRHQRLVPSGILAAFGGQLADRKVTFTVPLETAEPIRLPEGVRVLEYPRKPPGPRMLELAVLSGWSSRFRRDLRFPENKFLSLYQTWIRRSTLGELPGTVLAVYASDEEEPLGMLTFAISERVGGIGLLAVLPRCHGRHLGSALMWEAHVRMRENGAQSSTVVTQLDNRGACALYRRCGYEIAGVQDFYHFWPQAGDRRVS